MKLFCKSIFTIVVLSSLFSGCTTDDEHNNLKKEFDDNKKELIILKKEFDEFKKLKSKSDEELSICKNDFNELLNTGSQRIIKARVFLSNKEYELAKKEYQEIIQKFPNSVESKSSIEELKDIENILNKQKVEEEKRKKEEEQKKILGFKILKENQTRAVEYNTIKFENLNISNKWSFDDYGDSYYYRNSERDSNFITARVKITSTSKNPKLPLVSAYQIVNNKLILIKNLEYKFAKWSDYGTYLGNYADYNNDFAHTKTVSFSLGLEVLEKNLKDNPIFIVVSNKNSVERSYYQFATPKYSYNISYDDKAKDILNIEDFEKDYFLIKIFNKDKI